ncbi:MAG: hypothetical protein Q9163_005391 [Psora crenata]
MVDGRSKNEADYRQLLVQGVLAILLPTEDLENACLRTLVTDVIAEPILGNAICGKLCENWFVWGSITTLVDMVKAKIEPKAGVDEVEIDTRSRLERFGLLSEKEEKTERGSDIYRSMFQSIFWRILQYGYYTFVVVRFVIVGIFAAQSQPLRSTTLPKPATSANGSPMAGTLPPPFQPVPARVPMLSFRIFPLLSTFIDLPRRMPWLSGTMALWQHHLVEGYLQGVGRIDGVLDQ